MGGKLLRRVILLFIVSALGAGIAAAGEFPRPKADYSADMVMNMGAGPDGKPVIMTGKVYVTKESERREMERSGERMILISYRDNRPGVMLMPENKSYMEMAKGEGEKDPSSMAEHGDLTLKKLGSETIGGLKTTKYEVRGKEEDGTGFKGFMWLTKENVPVRMEGDSAVGGKPRHFRIEYRNVRIGPQDPALFKVPAGYRKINMPPMTGMGNMGGGTSPGGMPPGGMAKDEMKKQMEEMMKQLKEKTDEGN
jgi:hypothetical protein